MVIRRDRSRKLVGRVALALAVVFALALAGIAHSAAGAPNTGAPHGGPNPSPKITHFTGSTSQHKPISFMVSGATLSGLRFQLIVSCASGRRYVVKASNFASIKIVASKFHRTFTEPKPSATAKVKGSLQRNRAIGSVWLKRWIGPEHHSCAGSASFKLTGRH